MNKKKLSWAIILITSLNSTLLGTILFSASILHAQDNTAFQDSVQSMEEIQIKGHSLKAVNATSTVTVIDNAAIKNLIIEQPLRILEQVPGINVLGYGQGGVADQFSIRGFGGGGHEGKAGMELDGVLLNEAEGHADGYSDMNIIIPLNLEKISVYKGPSSALYGRYAQGGTIALETRKGGNYRDLKLTGGSFNTYDAQYAQGSTINIGNKEDALKTNFAMQLFTADGYLKNSGILKGNISGRVAYAITPKSQIALSLTGHKSNWNATGFIPREQYENKALRNYPHPTSENEGGNKEFLSERIDFNYKVTHHIKLLLFAYAVQQNFTRFKKFNFNFDRPQKEDFNSRRVLALGGSLNGNTKLFEKNFDWITGVEFYTEATGVKQWATSFRRRLYQTADRAFDINSFSAYAQAELNVHPLFRPTLGLRFDVFGGNEVNKAQSSFPKSTFDGLSHFSPKLGFRSTLLKGFDFKVNVSNGFALPDGELKYNSDAQLKPVVLWQYEAGFSYTDNKVFNLDITGFVLNSSREIMFRPNSDGDYIAFNAGKTRRAGLEADAKVNIMEGLIFRGALAYTHTKILQGTDEDGNNTSGKALTQVPKAILNLATIYTSPLGLGADLSFRKVADYYTTSDNVHTGGGYNVVNAKVFYNFNKMSASKGNVFFAVNNLLNAYYAETIFGNRLFSASPTRNFTIGVNYSF